MIAVLKNTIEDHINLDRLTGPFLNKELRVSSRHRRNYLLRASYIFFLLIFVALTWLNVVSSHSGTITYQKSRLAQAGRTITYTIVWFQFIAAQLVAVIMFCNSISDEIYHKTLGALLTTPVTSFQIVAGKLLSKLFQIILLLAISVPLLAVIRIFGGVSWNYILSSFFITLTAVIFAGSVSMFFSVLFKRAYVVIIITIISLVILYGLFPFISGIISGTFRFRFQYSNSSIFRSSPFFALSRVSDDMMSPGRNRAGLSWIISCIFILLDSFILLIASARILRSIALAHAVGQKSFLEKIFNRKNVFAFRQPKTKKSLSEGKIRHVWGPPIAWKEMKTKFSSREKMFCVIIIAIEVLMILTMYSFPYVAGGIGFNEAEVLYAYVFMGLAILSTVIFSSVSISSEIEAHTWSLLLMTTLSDWQILSGKFIGILRRCLPIWITLLIYFCLFLFSDPFKSGVLSLFLLIVLILAMVIFLYGAGIYFSSRFKNTSASFLAFFTLLLMIWFVIPFISSVNIPGNYLRYFSLRTFGEIFMNVNPFILAQLILISDFGQTHRFTRWLDLNHNSYESIVLMICIAAAYIIAGLLFSWRASCRFRKEIL